MRKTMYTNADELGMARALERGYKKRNGIFVPAEHDATMRLESFEDLLKVDAQREADGFPKKIKMRTIMVGPGKIVSVPYVEEEKLVHGEFEPHHDEKERAEETKDGQGGTAGDEDLGTVIGHGDEDVGDVLGEVPLSGEGEGQGESDQPTPGEDSGDHGIVTEAYRLGKELSEQFQLPNLLDKGKKVPTNEYVYDLTDRHRGSGQLLDKKATLRSVVKTNLTLDRITKDHIDMTDLIVGPRDKIYRVLSQEKVWKSQAMVFFLRDYSGSMDGEPTRVIVTQHLMIYAWLLIQYEHLVIPRFFVHDTESREVTVKDYFRLNTGGGTLIASGYREIAKTIESEGVAKNFNIYVFQGTDGDDYDSSGKQAIPELQKILGYVNRMGVTVLRLPWSSDRETGFELYVKASGLLESQAKQFRMHVMPSTNVEDEQNIEAIKTLIAQD